MSSHRNTPFWKYEGLGNDFIVVESDSPQDWIARAVSLCDRHRGIGADGVLVLGSLLEQPSMFVWNADGTSAEMCGNGLRCAALHRVRRGGSPDVVWTTEGGPHRAQVQPAQGSMQVLVEVDMAVPTFEPAHVPVEHAKPLIDGVVEVDREAFGITAVGMGNPHAVLFGEFDEDDRRHIGPAIQRAPLFPAGVNVGFASPVEDHVFTLHVLERGAGWTQACGTGACAAAAAAVATQRARVLEPIRIELPGGALFITIGHDEERAKMVGPARFVFEGQIPADL